MSTLGITSQTDSHVVKVVPSKMANGEHCGPEYIPGSFFIDTRYKSSVLTI